MARIFVSYSRKNKDFCRHLIDELQKRDLDFWVDWEGIPPTVDWMKEIEKGIEEADAFLAVVTADWISSRVCQDELNIAVKNGKRLIPVVPNDIVWNDVPPSISHLNFIFFTPNFDFDQQFILLFTALDTDYDWLKTHRRLQVKALEWERSNRENGFLLHGRDLEDAEQQISINANKDPHPTDIQRDYVLKSRQGATRQRRVTTGILIGLIAGMLGVIALLVKPYVEETIAKSQAQKQSPMISIPAGKIDFMLSDPIQSDIIHTQTFELPEFRIDAHPVTNQTYSLCVNVGKCTPPIELTEFNDIKKKDDPVVWLTVVQAAAYCEWIDRRLPRAPEWEHAAEAFAKSETTGEHFSISTHYEWTSSYQDGSSKVITGNWDSQLNHLQDWSFLQEKGILTPGNDLFLQSNLTGALVANNNLGFRCAQ